MKVFQSKQDLHTVPDGGIFIESNRILSFCALEFKYICAGSVMLLNVSLSVGRS